MLTKRIIPCLDIKNGKTVKGVNFENLRDAGDPVELAQIYAGQGADELVFLDITATVEDRKTVLNRIASCDPYMFLLIEPDVNHYSPDLTERLVNCYNLFGTIFKLVDKQKLEEREARAIKYKFFGREINDILGNMENKRTEKHEKATVWAERLIDAGFNLHRLTDRLDHPTMNIVYEKQSRFVTTEFEGTPMVAIMMASRQV